MRKLLQNLSIACIAGSLLVAPAFADRDHDHDKDRDDHHVEHHDRDHDRLPVLAHHRDHDRDDHDRDHHFHRTEGHPPGWSHGKKKGWGDCDVPPGQAKKEGCHEYRHHTVHPTSTKTVPVLKPHAEVHAHAGIDAKAEPR